MKYVEVVINTCFGGFGLSDEGMLYYGELKGFIMGRKFDKHGRSHWYVKSKPFFDHTIVRDDPALIKTVKKLGKKSWGQRAELKIIKIPPNVNWAIQEFEGMEQVVDLDRIWR